MSIQIRTKLHHGRQHGQVLVLLALGLVAMIATVGLVVDGGYVFAQQRGAQNGSDSAATAGALVIAENLPYRALGQAGPKTDADVSAAVAQSAASNKILVYTAYYTNLAGQLVDSSGAVAGSTASAATVGAGTLPAGAWGVQMDADRAFDTFFIRVVGINSFTASTTATVVSGYVEDAGAGNVLPITIPLNITSCDTSGKAFAVPPVSLWPLNTPVTLPLCKGPASGNVGWLDWSPPAGGTSELEEAILHPNNPAIPVPSWQFVTTTGNINAPSIEDALNTYAGKTVLLPFFDNSCTLPSTADDNKCPSGSGPGTGQNNYYHLPLFFGFKMQAGQAAFISGNNYGECGTDWHGGVGCLKGEIVSYVGPNVTVGAGTGTSLDAMSAVGVQLIK